MKVVNFNGYGYGYDLVDFVEDMGIYCIYDFLLSFSSQIFMCYSEILGVILLVARSDTTSPGNHVGVHVFLGRICSSAETERGIDLDGRLKRRQSIRSPATKPPWPGLINRLAETVRVRFAESFPANAGMQGTGWRGWGGIG